MSPKRGHTAQFGLSLFSLFVNLRSLSSDNFFLLLVFFSFCLGEGTATVLGRWGWGYACPGGWWRPFFVCKEGTGFFLRSPSWEFFLRFLKPCFKTPNKALNAWAIYPPALYRKKGQALASRIKVTIVRVWLDLCGFYDSANIWKANHSFGSSFYKTILVKQRNCSWSVHSKSILCPEQKLLMGKVSQGASRVEVQQGWCQRLPFVS